MRNWAYFYTTPLIDPRIPNSGDIRGEVNVNSFKERGTLVSVEALNRVNKLIVIGFTSLEDTFCKSNLIMVYDYSDWNRVICKSVHC